MNIQKYSLLIVFALCLWCNVPQECIADKCSSIMVMDGSEEIVDMDIDSTGHWWIVSSPYSRRYRITVDGKKGLDYDSVYSITFSADGLSYAYFGLKNAVWYLNLPDSTFSLGSSLPGSIVFSRTGILSYTYYSGNAEFLKIAHPDEQKEPVQLLQRIGLYHLSNDGHHFAYMSARGSGVTIVHDQQETDRYEQCFIAGFMLDNSLIYTGTIGQNTRLMRGEEEIASVQQIRDLQINNARTAYACIQTVGNSSSAYLYSDDFIKPFMSANYENVSHLTLHPNEPLMAFMASIRNQQFIVLNAAEYDAGIESGKPRFTHDGSAVYFCGDTKQEQFININGQKFIQKNGLVLSREYAMAPQSGTVAFATSSALVMQRLSDSFSFAGIMVDYVSTPLFNWRKNSYEALGFVNNRVYLMSCKP